jgi:hypothetical protein
LASAEEVFRTASAALGDRLPRIPDGETGRRKNWVNFQYAVLARHPAFEPSGPPIDPEALALESDGSGSDYQFSPLRLRRGAEVDDLDFGPLGYAENALASYRRFAQLKKEGVIHPAARFQVSLPTPLAPVAIFVVPENMTAVFPRYAEALGGELREILGSIPSTELAIQWDIAAEFFLWEGLVPPPPGDWKAMLFGMMAELGNRVPAGCTLGYHLCYGDRGHKHFIEPRDTANLVEVANGIAAGLGRDLDWMHLPVPRDRDDDAYFAPLAGLKLPAETRLFLGLLHRTDGVEGARRRIAAAERVVHGFGVATECGLGRRPPATIPEVLALHAEVCAKL